MIKRLAILLDRAADITRRKAEDAAQQVELKRRREAILQAASGPGDTESLEKLNALEPDEKLVARKLVLGAREEAGVAVMILDEAGKVRRSAIDVSKLAASKIEAALSDALTPFYPDSRQREKLIKDPRFPQPPALHAIRRSIDGLSNQIFHPEQLTEIQFGTNVLNVATRALKVIEEAKSVR